MAISSCGSKSAEAELIANVWGNRLAFSLHGPLSEMILSKPPHITYCDNSAVVQLTQQLSASKTRTRRLSMRASWLRHLVKHENVSMQFVPTALQKADILTKGLTACMHELAGQGLRLLMCRCHVPDFHLHLSVNANMCLLVQWLLKFCLPYFKFPVACVSFSICACALKLASSLCTHCHLE